MRSSGGLSVDYLCLSSDQSKLYLYLSNQGADGTSLDLVAIDGIAQPYRLISSSSEILAGDTCLVSIPFADGRERLGSSVTVKIRTGSYGELSAKVRLLEPFFPFGIYAYDPIIVTNPLQRADLVAHNINTVRLDALHCDAAGETGVRLISYWKKEWAEEYRDHPALLAWKVADEPDIPGRQSPDEVREMTKQMRRSDPCHPNFVNLCSYWRLPRYAGIADITTVDPYVISRSLEIVSDWADRISRLCRPGATWSILQAFRYWKKPGDRAWIWPRFPAPEEERLMTYMAIGHGAKGILYYLKDSPDEMYYSESDPVEALDSDRPKTKALWDGIGAIGGEIRIIGGLLVTGDPVRFGMTNNGSVEACTILNEDAVVLILINHNYTTSRDGFSLRPAEEVVAQVRTPWEVKEVIRVDGGTPARVGFSTSETFFGDYLFSQVTEVRAGSVAATAVYLLTRVENFLLGLG